MGFMKRLYLAAFVPLVCVPAATARVQAPPKVPAMIVKIADAVEEFILQFKGDATCFGAVVKLGDPRIFRKELAQMRVTVTISGRPQLVEYKRGALFGILPTPQNEMRLPFDPLREKLTEANRLALYHESIHQIESLRGVKRDNGVPGAERNTDYMSEVVGALGTWAAWEKGVLKPAPDSEPVDPDVLLEHYRELAEAMRNAEKKWGPDKEMEVWAGIKAKFNDIQLRYLSGDCRPELKALAERYAGLSGLIEREYWDTSKKIIKREYEYVFDKFGRKTRQGKERVYYSSGKLSYEATRKDNALDGPVTRYWGNGQVFDVSPFKDGVKTGPSISYWSDGKIRSQGEFRKNRKCGIWSFFLENGNLEARGSYYRKFSTIVVGCGNASSNDPADLDAGLSWECGNKFGKWTVPGGGEKVFEERGDLDDEVNRAIYGRPKSALEIALESRMKSLADEAASVKQQISDLAKRNGTPEERARLDARVATLEKEWNAKLEERREESERINAPIRAKILAKEATLEDLCPGVLL